MSDDIELEACGPEAVEMDEAQRQARRPRPALPSRRRLLALGAVVLTLAAAGLALARRDSRSAAERRLAAIESFVAERRPVTFSVDYRAVEDGEVVGSTALAGRLDGQGRAAWTETSGVGWEPHPFVEEHILVGHGVYSRAAEDAARVARQRWVYASRQEFDGGLRRKRERPFAFFDSASDSPLVGAVLTGDFETVVGDLGAVSLSGNGVLRATRRVTDLFPGAVRNATLLNVEIKAAADGRPQRLVLRHDLGRLGEDRHQKVTVTEVGFAGWGRPSAVPEVDLADIDTTPEIDEEAFAASSFSPILAPSRPPAGLVLTGAELTAAAHPSSCPGATFQYESPAGRTLFLKHWFCTPEVSGQEWSNADGVEEPFTAGAYQGSIRRGPTGRAVVRLPVPGDSFIYAETDLGDDVLRAAFASLAPVDFAAQPVERHLPPA